MASVRLLLDRDEELSRLRASLTALPGGTGIVWVVEGAAGLGKSRLLDWLADEARNRGMRVLRARGDPLERDFAFGLVRQLFEPVLAGDSDGSVLEGPARNGAAIFNPDASPTSTGELSALHGLYWLTANVCADPTVAVIDDMQWSDPSSMRFLNYLQPRVHDLPLMLAVVVRRGGPGSPSPLLARFLGATDIETLSLDPLSPSACARVVAETAGTGEVAPDFAAHLYNLTGGNPLLVQLLAKAVHREGLDPARASDRDLTAIASQAVSHYTASRLAALPEAGRQVAESVAVLGSNATLTSVAALAEIEILTASDIASDLGAEGLLRVEADGVSFDHPLMREAVYDLMAPSRRATAHARAADLFADSADDPERVASHILQTPPGTATGVLERLAAAAEMALRRGSPDAALSYLQRCLAEPMSPDRRVLMLDRAARIATHVDLGEAVRLLQACRDLTEDADERPRILARLGVAYGFLREPERACEALVEALATWPPASEDERRAVEATLLVAGFVVSGRLSVRSRIPSLLKLPPLAGTGSLLLEAVISAHEMAACIPAAAERARGALGDPRLVREANAEGPVVCGWLTLIAADDPLALSSMDEAVDAAYRTGSLRALASASTFRAFGALCTGDLLRAEADARVGLELARTEQVDMDSSYAAAYLADALMELGRVYDAARVLEENLPRGMSQGRPIYYAKDAQTRLLRMMGDHERAVAAALEARHAWESFGIVNPAWTSWRSELALASHACGEDVSAREVVEEELHLARDWGGPRAVGRALRVHGLLTGGSSGLDELEESVDVLSGCPARLEWAWSTFELGAALRRAGQRKDAQTRLQQALDLAHSCSADRLVGHAMRELRIAGFRPRRTRMTGPESLTSSERRVAELAARGSTNREIAQRLFVSNKTVEVHLTSTYRKLGIAHRRELRHHLDANPGGEV